MDRRIDLTPKPAPEVGSALREIAGRIKHLSYRDMMTLACTLKDALRDYDEIAAALLEVSDRMEKA